MFARLFVKWTHSYATVGDNYDKLSGVEDDETDYAKAGEMKRNFVLSYTWATQSYAGVSDLYEHQKFSVTSRHEFVLITTLWSIKSRNILPVHILSVLCNRI